MLVSVAIPVLNEEKTIGATIDSLLVQSLKPAEIVVADGGSTDRTRDVVLSYNNAEIPIKLVDNRKKLPGAGRNAAVRNSVHDYIACMDAGNVAEPKWLEELALPFTRDENIDAVYGRFLPKPCSMFERCVASVIFFNLYSCTNSSFYVNSEDCMSIPFSGSSLLFRKSAWEKAGGFSDTLRTSEDKLFGKSLLSAKRSVYFNPYAVVLIQVRKNYLALLKQYLFYGIGNGKSGQIPGSLSHLALKYVSGVFVLMASFAFPWLLLCLAAGFFAYVWRQGYVHFSTVNGRFPQKREWLTIPGVLVARDIGTILGTMMGYFMRVSSFGIRIGL